MISTWNVKGIKNKENEIMQELEKLNRGITILTETKKKGNGQEIIGNCLRIWSGVNKNESANADISLLVTKMD